jgi:hypothetical protein
MRVHRHHVQMNFRVLLYPEDAGWIAHALELDIPAEGNTADEALKELRGLVETQVSFAASRSQPELVRHPAPMQFFERWEAANQAQILGLVSKDKTAKVQYAATILTIDRPASSPRRFHRVAEPTCA